MTTPDPGATRGKPQRVRITGPRRDVRPRSRRSVTGDIDEQTGVGEVYLRALIRTQLLLGLATVALVVVPLALLPVVFGLWPSVRELQVGPVPLWWLILGVLVYPAILAVGWWYVRHADRNEDEFADLVEGR